MLDGKIEAAKLTISGVVAALITAFGVNHRYITVLLILMALDTALGWMKGFKTHNFTSFRAKWGFAGKIVELALLYLLGRLDWAFDTNGMMANIGVLYYGIVELASIVENIHDGGLATLPPGLVDVVGKVKGHAGKAVMDRAKKIIASMTGINLDAPQDEKGETANESDQTNNPE